MKDNMNLSGRQERWKWVDPFVGQISLLGLKQSHEALRVTHMKHHAHTNDPELDTNYDAGAIIGGNLPWQCIVLTWK